MRAVSLLVLLAPGLAFAGWRDDVKTAVDACAVDPGPCDLANDVFIRETRAGTWMVQDPRLEPAVLPPLLDRLERETDPQLRAALADGAAQILLGGVDPSWHVAWAELAGSDRHASVRAVLINSLRRAPESAAVPGLRAALASADPETRRHAASVMGRSTHAALFVDDLLVALKDPEGVVRASAVTALGHVGDARALPAVRAMTGDEAVAAELPRALERLGG
jgi:HEAT repeat protein